LDAFFSFFILGIPGVLTYLLSKYIGNSSTSNRSNVELLAITSLLWVPTVLLSILIFNILLGLTEKFLITMGIEYFRKYDIIYISNINELMNNLNAFVFIGCFTMVLGVSSVILSAVTPILSNYLTAFINFVRVRKGYAKITPGSSVWQLFFIENNDTRQQINGESPLVVEISYLDAPNQVIYGCLKYYSADGSRKKHFHIEEEESWTNFLVGYEERTGKPIPYTGTFYDGDTKILIREINQMELFESEGEDTNE
jgi:hypothetical protein